MPGLVEQTAVKAVLTPDKLKFGRAAPPHEAWAESVIRDKNLTDYDTLKKRLLDGTPVLDTTESDLKGLEGKANGIGKDIDPATGNITRSASSLEDKQFQEAKDGLEYADDLLKYESLPEAEREAFAEEVSKILEERQGGKELFHGKKADERIKIADNFIRTHKRDRLNLLNEKTGALNTESRADTTTATNEMYESEEAHAKAQLELDAAKDAAGEAFNRLDTLKTSKGEFDTPTAGNKGHILSALTNTEQGRLQTMAPLAEKIRLLQKSIEEKQELFQRYAKDPKGAKNAGIKNLKDFSNTIQQLRNDLATELNAYLPMQVQQEQLLALRQEKASLPDEIQKAQKDLDTKKIEQKAKESALNKVANGMRVAKEHKEMVDEYLASTTRDLWKRVMNECADKDMDAMLASLTSPEGRSAIMAGALTILDRKMEDAWSTPHRRLRRGVQWGGRFPAVRLLTWEDVPVVDRKKINQAFTELLKDKTGDGTETIVKNMLGETWKGLSRSEQQQAVASYVTKLTHRKVINLRTNLRDGEIRALRSGPFADELIKIGLIRNADFRQEVTNIPGVDASHLDNPSADTLQHIKGGLDKSNLLSLLMLGLSPLSMMKQSEQQHA